MRGDLLALRYRLCDLPRRDYLGVGIVVQDDGSLKGAPTVVLTNNIEPQNFPAFNVENVAAWDWWIYDGRAWIHHTGQVLEYEPDDKQVRVFLTVTDPYGSQVTTHTTIKSGHETMDAVTMPDGARITAHPEAGNQGVFILRIEEGQDESDYLYFFREHSRPRLALHRDGRVALLARDNKTQNFVRIEAAELMRKWGAPIVIWNNKPRYADILTLRGAVGPHEVEVSIAAVRRADDTEILFKESKDGGKTWPADGQAVKVGTMPGAVPIVIREARAGVLEILDGAKVLFRSEKGGIADSWRAA